MRNDLSSIDRFVRTVVAKGDFKSPRRDARLYEEMTTAYLELAATSGGMTAFRQLLQHSAVHVRLWVAAQLLAEGEASAQRVLEAIASGGGVQAFNARSTLAEYTRGTLRPPFKQADTPANLQKPGA
jgi:hypothetical protein